MDAGPQPGLDAGPGNGHKIKTVFIIMEENQDWTAFNGSSSAPYINNTLLPMASHATNYSNPINPSTGAGLHPSEPNYLWLEAGTNFGITADGTPATDTQNTTQHLVTLLENAGHTWKSYQEDIDGTTCPLAAVNNYAPKHNPMVYFDDVTDSMSTTSAYCIQHVRPFSELATDLQNGTVAEYNFITPDLCDDGHNDCLSTNPLNPSAGADEVSQTDTWLKTNVPTILNSQAYKDGGALIITWDESEPSLTCVSLTPTCPIGFLLLSPYAKGNNYAGSIKYDHSSTLRTMEEIFSVSPFLGGAANATDLSDLFTQFP